MVRHGSLLLREETSKQPAPAPPGPVPTHMNTGVHAAAHLCPHRGGWMSVKSHTRSDVNPETDPDTPAHRHTQPPVFVEAHTHLSARMQDRGGTPADTDPAMDAGTQEYTGEQKYTLSGSVQCAPEKSTQRHTASNITIRYVCTGSGATCSPTLQPGRTPPSPVPVPAAARGGALPRRRDAGWCAAAE